MGSIPIFVSMQGGDIMGGNGCTHVNTSNSTEQRYNDKTKEWETWLITTCTASGCGTVTAESKIS